MDDSQENTPGLFCPDRSFKGTAECWKNCLEEFNWNHDAIYKDWNLDEYQHIQLINYIRQSMSAPNGSASALISELKSIAGATDAPWKNEKYLIPVIPDDPLLSSIGLKSTVIPQEWSDDEDEKEKKVEADTDDLDFEGMLAKVKRLELENKRLKALIDFDENVEATSIKEKEKVYQNQTEVNYFECYAQFDVHSLMLRDAVRTLAYQDFCVKNAALLKDKVVMDIGCGTGILSMFAATAGAKQVIAVDKSDIIESAQLIVESNKLKDKIHFCKQNVETIENIKLADGSEIDSVDIIISEWMGYCLLYECMLPSVLVTRDKWIARQNKPVKVYPDKASMHIQAWSDEAFYNNKLNFWSNVYGYNMNLIRSSLLKEAMITVLPGQAVKDYSNSSPLRHFDINTATIEELDFTSSFNLTLEATKPLHGFVVHFDIGFELDCTAPVFFSTSPQHEPTHWEQTLLFLDPPVPANKGDNIQGEFTIHRSTVDGHRDVMLTLKYEINKDGNAKTLFYKLS